MKKTKKTIFSALSVAALSLCAAGVFGLNAAEKKSANAEAGAEESTQTSFQMLGASIRYTTDEDSNSGIRFGISMSKTEWETYRAKTSLETGIILIPETVIGNKTEITLSTEKAQINATYNDAINAWNEDPNDDTLVRSTVVLTKIPVNDYNNVIWARGYLKYTEDGAEKVVYTETVDRSIDEVAYQLLKTETDATKKAALQAYLDANEYTVMIKDEEGNKVDSQKGNYGDPLKTPQKISDDDAVYQFTSWKEENAGYIKGNAEYVANFKKVTAFENVKVTVTDAAKFGLNGVEFTLTNKANTETSYTATVENGELNFENVKVGTYSVSAVLIPGTTTAGADLELKQETLTYNAEALIFNPRQTETCNVQFGVNNSLALGSSSQLTPHIGANIKNLAGEFYVGNLFKFTKEQLTNAFNAKGAVGLALYTGKDEYFGLNIVAASKAFHLRVLGDWGKCYTANIGDFSSGSYQDDTNHLAAALTGDGIYGVLHRSADGKVTMYLYNAAKTSLLLKVETESTKTKAVYGIAAGYWDNKTENHFDCEYSDIRVSDSLAGALNRANEDVEITQTATQCNIETDKTAYKIGDTVKLTIKPSDAEKYPIFASLKINGVECASSATTDEAGNKVYSFVAYDKQITVEAEYTDKLNANITITDAAAYGLNGVAFTLTNKSNSSIVYNVTVADGKLAIPNAEIGTYSVKAVLIPGTTTTGADITINAASLTYNASSMFRGSIKSATSVSSGENNSITMPSGGANHGCGTVVDAISGNVFVGTKIKFTNDEMVAMINSGKDSGLGIAMFTGSGDVYTGIQFWAIGGSLKLRTMQNWGAGAFVTLGTVTDNNFTVTTTESDWIAVANAIVGDGLYLVQQKDANNKLTYYFYNADKTTLLKKYETGFAYSNSGTLYGVGTYRWNTGFAYTVSDFRVGTSLAALGVTAE